MSMIPPQKHARQGASDSSPEAIPSSIAAELAGKHCGICRGPVDTTAHRALHVRPDGVPVPKVICAGCFERLLLWAAPAGGVA